jgi:hypothetical protein
VLKVVAPTCGSRRGGISWPISDRQAFAAFGEPLLLLLRQFFLVQAGAETGITRIHHLIDADILACALLVADPGALTRACGVAVADQFLG